MSAWAENERIRREASGQSRRRRDRGRRVGVRAGVARVHVRRTRRRVDRRGLHAVDERRRLQRRGRGRRGECRAVHARRAGGAWCCGSVVSTRPTAIRSLATMQYARRGVLLDVGAPDSYVPMIDADDAAAAVVAALDAPAGTYDIVDDEPLHRARAERRVGGRGRSAPAVARARVDGAEEGRATSRRRSACRTGRSARRRAGGRRRRTCARVTGSSPARSRIEPALPGRVRLMLWVLAVQRVRRRRAGRVLPTVVLRRLPVRARLGRDGRSLQRAPRSATSARSTSRCSC